jgi:hypothetical protein
MPEDAIEFSNRNGSVVPVEFLYDGSAYKNGESTVNAPFKFAVGAKGDNYTVAYVEYFREMNDDWEYEYTNYLLTEEDEMLWFHIEDDKKGSLSLSVDNNSGDARNGYLLVFPNAVYNKVKDNFEKLVLSSSEGIAPDYEKYIAVEVKQDANPSLAWGFKITDGNGDPLYSDEGEIEIVSLSQASGMNDEEIIAKYGTSNVHILNLPLGIAYDYIVAEPIGFKGLYVECDYDLTGWGEDVVVSMETMTSYAITGITETLNSESSMKLTFIDPQNAEVPFAVLLIERY